MVCPDKNNLQYQGLEKEFGKMGALAAFDLAGESIPSIEEARKLLGNKGLGINSGAFVTPASESFLGLTKSHINPTGSRTEPAAVPTDTPSKIAKLEADQRLIQLDDTINPETQQRRHKYYVLDENGNRLFDIKESVTESIHKGFKSREGQEETNLLLAEYGTKHHKIFEDVIRDFLNVDGSIGMGKTYDSEKISNPAVFWRIHSYVSDLMDFYRGKNVKIIPEAKIARGKDMAGTIDLLVIHEDGSYDKYDWKFIRELSEYKGLDKARKLAFKEQSDKLADILKTEYGLSDRRVDMFLPIKVDATEIVENGKVTDLSINKILIAPFNVSDLGDKEMYLQPFVVHYKLDDNSQLQDTLNTLHSLYTAQIHNYDRNSLSERTAIDIRVKRLQDAMFGVTFRKDLSTLTKYLLSELAYVPLAVAKIRAGDTSIRLDRVLERLNALEIFGTQGLKPQYREQLKNPETTADEIQILKDRMDEFQKALGEIGSRKKMIEDVAKEYAREEGKLSNINTDLVEAELTFSERYGTTMSQIQMANTQVASQKLFQGIEDSKRESKLKTQSFRDSKIAIEKTEKRPVDVYKKLLLEETKNGNHRFKHKFKKEFFDERKKVITGDPDVMQAWFIENTTFDRERYERDLEHITKDLQEASTPIEDPITGNVYEAQISVEDMNAAIQEYKERYDVGEDFTNIKALKRGDFANKYLIGNDKWHSDTYKELGKHPELLKLYNDSININKELASLGLIEEREIHSFYPHVSTSMKEGLKQGEGLDAINRFWHEISVSHGELNRKETINELTGEPWKEISMPFLHGDMVRGQDKNVPEVYIEVVKALEKYKALKALENPLSTILIAEKGKKIKPLDKYGKLTEAEVANKTNAEFLADIIDLQLYNEVKGFESTSNLANSSLGTFLKLDKNRELSMKKLIHGMITSNTIIRLAISVPSTLANLVGGQGNINIQGKTGIHFNSEMMNKTMAMYLTRDKKLYTALRYFDFTMTEKPEHKGISDYALWGQRALGDRPVEEMIGGAMLQMYKLNSDGKIVNIRKEILQRVSKEGKTISPKELLREIAKESKENSLLATMKMPSSDKEQPYWEVNGKIVDLNKIPLDSEGKKTAQMSPFTNMKKDVLQVTYKCIGNMNSEDRSGMHMYDMVRAITQFRSWIPGQLQSRFGKWNYESITEEYSVGRWREFFSNFFGKDGIGGFMKLNLARYSFFGGDLANPSLRGASDARYEKIKANLAKRGVEFKMSQEEFFHHQVGIAKSIARETLFTLGTLSLLTLVRYLSTDEDDKDTRARLAYTHKLLDKFYNEFSFFYNPSEFQQLFKNSVPVVSLLGDMTNVLRQPLLQTYGYLTGDEKLQEKAKPVKAALKLIPGASGMARIIGIWDDDIRKYMNTGKIVEDMR